MINTCQTVFVGTDDAEPFEDRIDILFHELELAIKWQVPSVLLAIYSSEYVHGDAQLALENRLLDLGQKTHHIIVKSQDDADISLMISELADLQDVVIFVEGLRWGGAEADFHTYGLLNKHREFFIENRVRVVFWLTENEAVDLAHYAPDYWTFRHRVIEFVDLPKPEQISLEVLESTMQGTGEFTDSNEDLDAKITLRTALLTDLPDGDESTAARANLLLTLGVLHWRRGDYEKASQFLNTALAHAAKLQDNRFAAQCHNALALVKTGSGRIEEAIKSYQSAIELAPDQISPWNNLGNLYTRLERYEEALTAFQKAVEQDPSDVVSWSGLGDSYRKLGRNDDAIYAFLKNVELAPGHVHTWTSLGDIYSDEGQLDDALSAYQKALEIDLRDTSSWIGLGTVYRMQGNLENAALAYQTAIEIDPQNASAWNELGNIFYNSKAYPEAIRAYRQAIGLDPAYEEAYNSLIALYTHTGNYADVIPLLQKEIDLQHEPADKAILWNQLGNTYRKLDDYDNAIVSYRKADELDPGAAVPEAAESVDESSLTFAGTTEEGSGESVPGPEAGTRLDESHEAEPASPLVASALDDIQMAGDDKTSAWSEDVPAVVDTDTSTTGSDNLQTGGDIDMIAPGSDDLPVVSNTETTAAGLDNLPVVGNTETTTDVSDNVQMVNDIGITATMPEDVHEAENPETTILGADVDFAKWLEGLSAASPDSIVPEETDTSEKASEEVEQVPELETLPETISNLNNSAEGPQPEPARHEFETAKAVALSAEEPGPAVVDETVPFIEKEQYGGVVPEKSVPEDSSPVLPATSGDTTVQADSAWEDDPGQTQAEIDEKSAQIWNELGNIYYNIVAYDDAIKALNKAIDLDPSYGWSYNNLALLYIHKGQYTEAIPLLHKGIRLLDGTKDKALLWNRLGDAYRRMDQPEKAASAYKKAVELDPDNVSLLTRARFSLLGNCRA